MKKKTKAKKKICEFVRIFGWMEGCGAAYCYGKVFSGIYR